MKTKRGKSYRVEHGYDLGMDGFASIGLAAAAGPSWLGRWLGIGPRVILVKENFSFYKNPLYFQTYLIQI
jgi:hypothetical protein